MIWYQGLVPFGGIAAGLGFLFILSLILSPYWQRNEARAVLLGIQNGRPLLDARQELLEEMGSFLGEGRTIQILCADEEKPPPDLLAENWNIRLEQFLEANLGKRYVMRLRSGSGLPMAGNSINSIPHRNLWGGIERRLARLEQFQQELSR